MGRYGLVQGKVVLVTGGGSGIGAATVDLLVREGAEAVTIADIDEDRANTVINDANEFDAKVMFQCTDVSDRYQVDAAVEAVVAQYGRIDCAVNAAGVSGVLSRISEYKDDDWSRVVKVNLDGVFYCMRAEIRAMLVQGEGAIVNVSSGAHVRPMPGLGAYSATKSGVVALTRSTAGEYARRNIRINSVLPGPTETPMFGANLAPNAAKLAALLDRMPMGRVGKAYEQAEAIVWLCSDRSSYVHGAALLVDGANHAYAGPAVPDLPLP